MATQAKRATVYLEPYLHKALAEDAEDLAAFEERGSEPLIGYEELIKRLKKDVRL